MYEEYYIDTASVPEIFRQADRILEKELKPLRVMKKPREIPMPRIEGCKGTRGPIFVTEDWYLEKKKEMQVERSKSVRDMQIDMMKLLAKKERLRFKLGELDPSKKSDSKMIVSINVKLKNIDAELSMLEMQSGVHLDELDKGTKLGRFVGSLKQIGRKIVKKVKKFYRKNLELLNGIASITLPVFGGFLVRKFLRI